MLDGGLVGFLRLYVFFSVNVMEGGVVGHLFAYHNSAVSLQEGAHISHSTMYGSSYFELNGGDISYSSAYGSSHFEVYRGRVSFLRFFQSSSANIHYLDDLSYLIIGSDSDVTLFANSYEYIDGSLSGNWQNGESFNFWLLSSEDGSIGPTIFDSIPDNLTFSAVPLPSSIFLLFFSLLGVVLVNYKNVYIR